MAFRGWLIATALFLPCIHSALAFVPGAHMSVAPKIALSRRCESGPLLPKRHNKRTGMLMQSSSTSASTGPMKSRNEILSEIRPSLAEAFEAGTADACIQSLDRLKENGVLSKWSSTDLKSRVVSQNELKRALKTEMELDDLFGLKGVAIDLMTLTLASFAASAFFIIGGSFIGGEAGGAVYWVTYLGGALPLLLIGVGSAAPGAVGGLLARAQWALDPTNTRERRVRHEAAHLLCGYLCGLPIEAYQIEPTPECKFFDRKEGNIKDREVWKKARPFSAQEVDVLSVVCLSGLMGELTKYSKADGAQGDLELLQDAFYKSDVEALRKPNAREAQTRWGALEARRLLEEHSAAFDRLFAVMQDNASGEMNEKMEEVSNYVDGQNNSAE